MEDELRKLEAELETTKESLRRNFQVVEGEVKGRVDQIRSRVNRVAKSFNLRHQVEAHPVGMVAGAALAGFLFGASGIAAGAGAVVVKKRRTVARAARTGLSKLTEQFQDEIGIAKGVLFAEGVHLVAQAASRILPNWSERFDEIAQGTVEKLGERHKERERASSSLPHTEATAGDAPPSS